MTSRAPCGTGAELKAASRTSWVATPRVSGIPLRSSNLLTASAVFGPYHPSALMANPRAVSCRCRTATGSPWGDHRPRPSCGASV